MTFEQLAHDHLFNNGMFENDVTAVIETAKKDDVLETMKGRWSDKLDDYPPFMERIFILSLDHVALKYIDATMPKAWFRACFEHAKKE